MARTICKNSGCGGAIPLREQGMHQSRCPPCQTAYKRRQHNSRQAAAQRKPCSGWGCRKLVMRPEFHTDDEPYTGRCHDCQNLHEQEQSSMRRMAEAAERKENEAHNDLMFYKRLRDKLECNFDPNANREVLHELLTYIIERKTK